MQRFPSENLFRSLSRMARGASCQSGTFLHTLPTRSCAILHETHPCAHGINDDLPAEVFHCAPRLAALAVLIQKQCQPRVAIISNVQKYELRGLFLELLRNKCFRAVPKSSEFLRFRDSKRPCPVKLRCPFRPQELDGINAHLLFVPRQIVPEDNFVDVMRRIATASLEG